MTTQSPGGIAGAMSPATRSAGFGEPLTTELALVGWTPHVGRRWSLDVPQDLGVSRNLVFGRRIGKTVQIRCGPAAVIGDERCNKPLLAQDAAGRCSQ